MSCFLHFWPLFPQKTSIDIDKKLKMKPKIEIDSGRERSLNGIMC